MDSSRKKDYQLKEATVLLTKLSEEEILKASPHKILFPGAEDKEQTTHTEDQTVNQNQESDSDSFIDVEGPILVQQTEVGTRKRKRKNSAPRRKVVVIGMDEMDVDDELCSNFWYDDDSGDDQSLVLYGDSEDFEDLPDCDYDSCNNNNAKPKTTNQISKFAKTPMFKKKEKSEVKPDFTLNATNCEISNVGTHIPECSSNNEHLEQTRNENLVHKRKVKRKKMRGTLPMILPRQINLKPKESRRSIESPVVIAPKQQTADKLSRITSSVKLQSYNDFQTNKSSISSDTEDNSCTNPASNASLVTTFPNPVNEFEVYDGSVTTLQNAKMQTVETRMRDTLDNPRSTKSFSNIPLTVLQSASSTTDPSEIRPVVSKPRYESRLTSKSGTKYIVRKDSIISADIDDLISRPTESSSSADSGRKLILKLPEGCLNGKMFFDKFVKKNDYIDGVLCPGSIKYDTTPASSKSQLPKLTNAKVAPQDIKATGNYEKPIILQSTGDLEDLKRELSIENPNLFKTEKGTPPKASKASNDKTMTSKGRVTKLEPGKPETPSDNFRGPPITAVGQQPKDFQNMNQSDGITIPSGDTSGQFPSINEKSTTNISTTGYNRVTNLIPSPDQLKSIVKDAHAAYQGQKVVIRYTGRKNMQPPSDKFLSNLRGRLQSQQTSDKVDVPKVSSVGQQSKDLGEVSVVRDDLLPTLLKQTALKSGHAKQFGESSSSFQKIQTDASEFTEIKSEPKNEFQISDMPKKEHNVSYFQTMPSPVKPKSAISSSEYRDSCLERLKRGPVHIKPKTPLKVQTAHDHAYTRAECIQTTPCQKYEANQTCKEISPPITVTKNLSVSISSSTSMVTSQNGDPIPVYALRCGERVVLLPASQSTNVGTIRNDIPRSPKNCKKVSKSPSKTLKKTRKILPNKSNTGNIPDFAKICNLTSAPKNKSGKPESKSPEYVTVDFKNLTPKRSKNQMKHMCAVVVQIKRSENNSFTFSKDVLALSFANGSNPDLVRWHDDGIHAALVTYNGKSKIQHMTVNTITSGFYCMHLKNDPKHRKNRTFEGLLTSSLPNEDLLHSEKDFLAIGPIKTIMDPTISTTDIKTLPGTTLTDALCDVLPSHLMQVYNPTISDRSYKPKVDDRNWYSVDKFELFTKSYGRARGFQANGCRITSEESH